MKLLFRYILREHAKVLVWIFLLLSILCFLFDFFERWDDILENQAPTSVGLSYLLLRMPQYVLYILPVSVLLSTFITLGLMGRNYELMAIKTSGVSGYTIAAPLLSVASVLSALSFFWAEGVVPACNRESSRIWQVEIKKSPQRSLLREGQVWLRVPSSQGMTIYRIGFIKGNEAALPGPRLRSGADSTPVLKDVSILRMNKTFDLLERIDARQMLWEEGRWVFEKGIRWGPDSSAGYWVERFDRQAFPLEERPEDFQWVEQDVEKMGFFELLEYIRRARNEGYDVGGQVTDLHFKVASCLFSLVTVLFTVPLALMVPPRSGGLALGVALSMAVGFLYYLVMALGLAFGHAEALPPFLAAWGGNILFGLCGTWWMLHMRH